MIYKFPIWKKRFNIWSSGNVHEDGYINMRKYGFSLTRILAYFMQWIAAIWWVCSDEIYNILTSKFTEIMKTFLYIIWNRYHALKACVIFHRKRCVNKERLKRFQGHIAKCAATFTRPYRKAFLEKANLFQKLSAKHIAVIQQKQKTKNSCS